VHGLPRHCWHERVPRTALAIHGRSPPAVPLVPWPASRAGRSCASGQEPTAASRAAAPTVSRTRRKVCLHPALEPGSRQRIKVHPEAAQGPAATRPPTHSPVACERPRAPASGGRPPRPVTTTSGYGRNPAPDPREVRHPAPGNSSRPGPLVSQQPLPVTGQADPKLLQGQG